jgi:hypothetical protein
MFLNKDHIKEKLDRIGQIKGIIGEMMMLTTTTKRIVANFTSSRLYIIQTCLIQKVDSTSSQCSKL